MPVWQSCPMIAQQFALPRGVLGRIVGTVMARANAALTRRVVGALRLKGDETVLEIGPGPGTGLALLPLPPGSCDAVCAVNNVQLWQPLPESLARVFDVLTPGGALALGVTERAVLPGGGSVGRTYDSLLVPDLERAGFVDLAATWERGGNGHELLITARRSAA